MKKSILLYLGAVIVLAGCAKTENDEVVPENEKQVITLNATVNEPASKVSVNASGEFLWQVGDQIVVFANKQGKFSGLKWVDTFDSGKSASFEVPLGEGETLGDYAIYPSGEESGMDSDGGIRFGLNKNYGYSKDATLMPMLGTISGKDISFKAVGGVLKITINNVPEKTSYLRFSVDNKMIAGAFPVIDKDGQKIIEAVDYEEGSADYINYIDYFIPSKQSIEICIPLPCGTYNGLTFSFFKYDGEELYSKTANIPDGLTIGRNQVVIAPTLTVPIINSHEYVDLGLPSGL